MADIQDPNALDQPSPGDDLAGNDTGRGNKRNRASMAGDDDDDDDEKGGRERRKIEIKFIQVSSLLIRRIMQGTDCYPSGQVPSSHHILKEKGWYHEEGQSSHPPIHHQHTDPSQAYELSVLTGTQVLLLVVSETGLVYTFTTPKLQPLVTKAEGKNLIQACLNAPEPSGENGADGADDIPSPDDVQSMPQPPAMPRQPAQQTGYMTHEQQQQALYYQQLQQQQNQGGQYAGMPQMPHQQRA
jgi:pheromone receptor transcription factor